MFRMLDKQRLERTRQMMRGEQLHKMKFEEAFHDTLSMMALLIDMTRAFTQPSEFRRIPDHCDSLPEFRNSMAEMRKTRAADLEAAVRDVVMIQGV